VLVRILTTVARALSRSVQDCSVSGALSLFDGFFHLADFVLNLAGYSFADTFAF
jgi:hypothetical protein